MTQTSQNSNPGTLVMYKLKEENMWWPALLYPSHISAQPFMTADNFSTDYYTQIMSQIFRELSPRQSHKPIVCVLGHPNKPAGRPWWYQIDKNEETEPLTVSNTSDYYRSTSEAFQGVLYDTLNGIVMKKVTADECRIAMDPWGEYLPNVSPDITRGSARAAPFLLNDGEESSLVIDANDPSLSGNNANAQTKKPTDTPTNAVQLHNSKEDSPAMEASSENEPMEPAFKTAPFDIHASFAVAWDKLEDEGWYQHRSNKDWNMYYSQPHELGGQHFQQHELKEYLRDTYGWSPIDQDEDDRGSVVTTPDCRTKPQDPGQPLAESPDVSDGPLNASTLEREGWKVVKGGPLQNYLYLRPGVKKGQGREGVDYFTNLQDALDFYIEEVEDTRSFHSKPSIANTQPRRLLLDDEIVDDGTSVCETTSRKSATTKTATSFYRRVSDVSRTSKHQQKKSKSKDRKSKIVEVEKNGRANDQKTRKTLSAQATKTSESKEKSEFDPTPLDIIPLLQKIGFQLVDKKFLTFNFIEGHSSKFSMVGLPVFLARYGIPNIHKLKANDIAKITKWVRFANIPKATRLQSQLPLSENLSSKEIEDILRAFNFEIFSGTIYIPNCPHNERIYGIHYFHEDRLQSDFRLFLGWALDYASMFEAHDDSSVSDGSEDERSPKSIEHLYFVSKLKVHTPEHDLYTKLRLWAATQDAPLPNFSARKLDREFIDALADPKIRVSLANVTKESSPIIEILSDENVELPPSRKARESKPSGVEKLKKYVPSWHEAYTGGRSNSAIFKLLRKLGFHDEGNNAISHPSIGGRRFSLEELRLYMVQNHIVDFEKKKTELDKSDLQTLHRWCAYINLDHEVFMPYVSKAKVQAETKTAKILQTLGFGCVSGDYYLPGADKNRMTRKSYSLCQLYEYCRSHEVWSINNVDEVGIHSHQKFGVELSDWVDMLLTMARVDAQIQAFKTPSKHEGRSKRRRESMASISPTKVNKSRKISLVSRSNKSDEAFSKTVPRVLGTGLLAHKDVVSSVTESEKGNDFSRNIGGIQAAVLETEKGQQTLGKTNSPKSRDTCALEVEFATELPVTDQGGSTAMDLEKEQDPCREIDGSHADVEVMQSAISETSPSTATAPMPSNMMSEPVVTQTTTQAQFEDMSMSTAFEKEQGLCPAIAIAGIENDFDEFDFTEYSQIDDDKFVDARSDYFTQHEAQ